MSQSPAGQIFRRSLNIQVSSSLLDALGRRRDRIRALVVGGSVRDAILGHEPKDIDIEVYGTSYDDLVEVLREYGRTDLVGRAFGVIKFRDAHGHEADISIPRRESKTGAAHRDFAASFDPAIEPREAAARRDFTVNALAWDPFTQEVHDYFGGVSDLEQRILRATSPAFAEDPLRVLRGMQFSGRFAMRIDAATAAMCRALVDEYRHISRERVAEEWMKLAVKGRRPGVMWPYLIETGWIAHYPHLARLVGVPQDPEWHPEGTVDVHVAHVMDAMAGITDREGIAGEDRAVLMLAALTHDIAKSLVRDGGTTMQREKGGRTRWTSHGHEEAGGPMAREFLGALGLPGRIVDRVVPLVENHLQHVRLAANGPVSISDLRCLADRLAPATIAELCLLIEADLSGRPPLPGGLSQEARRLADAARQDGIAAGPPPKLIQGRDVLPYFDNKPGPHIGDAVKAAYRAYLGGSFHDAEGGRDWLQRHLEHKVRLIRGSDIKPFFARPGPEIGSVLKAAWAAQVSGAFSDRQGAERWLHAFLARRGASPRP